MKKLMLASLFLFAGLFALSAQNLPTVRIVNNTGYDIYFLYVSPTESDEWGEDILGDEILKNGSTFTYRLPKPLSTYNVYDFLAEDKDEDLYIKMEISVVNNVQIVFTNADLDYP
jgi:hypothetical protein